MTRRALAFDLDGTLVDSVADLATALNAALAEVLGEGHARLPLSDDEVRALVGRGARKLVDGALLEATAEEAAPDLEERTLARFLAAYEARFLDQTRAYPGLVEPLAALANEGVPLVVATNKPARFARPIVEALFPGTFAAVLGPEDAGAHKPDPAILRVAEARAGTKLAAYVGDSLVDVETARRAGLPMVAVSWGLGAADELRGEHVTLVDDAAQLLRTLRALGP